MAMRRPALILPNAGVKLGRRFHVINGGGAYGQRKTPLVRIASSQLPRLLPNDSLASLRSETDARTDVRRKPKLLSRRPLQRSVSMPRRAKSNFSPAYFQQLGQMLRLQVSREPKGNGQTQTADKGFVRRLTQLVTCSEWPQTQYNRVVI